MLSLENAFNDDDMEDFNKRILERLLIEGNISFSCEPKLDGIAIELSLIIVIPLGGKKPMP